LVCHTGFWINKSLATGPTKRGKTAGGGGGGDGGGGRGSYAGYVVAAGVGFLRFNICMHVGVVLAGVLIAHVLVRCPRVGIILVAHFAEQPGCDVLDGLSFFELVTYSFGHLDPF
jgi:hypothetical protein